MKVLLSWLRDFVPVETSARELARALTLAGQAVDTVEERDGDAVLDLDLTSNRPDCLSHYGLAREIAAITGSRLGALDAEALRPEPAGDDFVRIEAPEACGVYGALLFEEVRIAPSGPAVADRLRALGQHGINNVADATNYTLLEMGHPTHAFDADRLRGGQIRVRWARSGETLTTLDGVERRLEPSDLVIADAERPVALAGVLGGLEAATGPQTRRVLLESAWFDPQTVRRTARRHGLHTEASHRFERGADPEAAVSAAGRIARLLHNSAQMTGPLRLAHGRIPEPARIRLRPERITTMLGKELDASECQRHLRALGCVAEAADTWRAPSWRPDLTREIDLIEELARLHGYDRFPSRLPAAAAMAHPLPEAGLRDRVRQQLRGRGFAEAISISFASEAECRQFAPERKPVVVSNPLNEEAAILRTSSVPSMLHLLQFNANRGVQARLFEIGKVYEMGPDGKPAERAVLTLGACDESLEFRNLRGELEAVLDLFALPPLECEALASRHFEPAGRLGAWAWLGRLQRSTAEGWKLPATTWVAEVDLARCYAAGARAVRFEPPPRFPGSERDFSFLFADTVTWAQVEAALREPAIPYLETVAPAEIFRGAALPAGQFSMLVRARFQSRERTLREEEVQAAADTIVQRLQTLGGRQR